MRKRSILLFALVAFSLMLCSTILQPPVIAGETLSFSSSAQALQALGMRGLKVFSEETGVKVDLYVGSSSAAVHRLMNRVSDIASSVERLHIGAEEYGYVETPFCKAPLIVITHAKTPVATISTQQLRGIFSGTVTNWKELGGPDKRIIVIVPGKDTGAYKNFRQLALRRFDMKYHFIAHTSTSVIQLIKHLPWSISFISRGAHTVHEAIKALKIDGLSPDDEGYPYSQTFSFVTKGEPAGVAKKLIDFVLSKKGKEIMRTNGMILIEKE